MQIQNCFNVSAPVSQAWDLLTDIEGIAPCMPGAKLTEIQEGDVYCGNVTVRLGPVTLTFDGTAHFEEMDIASHRARVLAQGSDKKGRGGATADITFQLQPADIGTQVIIDTDLSLSGSVAQYGRGAGMINELAAQLVGQFAESLHNKILAGNEVSVSAVCNTERTPATPVKPVSGLSLVFRSLLSVVIKGLKRILARP